jgi:hypothetical protein
MATEKFANNAQSNLAAAIAAGDTSLTVVNGSAFPASGTFRVLIDGEILLVTAVAGNTFTVTRGAEGTTASAHANAAYVTHVLTAAALLNCPRSMTITGDLEYLASGGAVSRLGIGSTGQVLTVAGGLPTWASSTAAADWLSPAVNAIATLTNADGNLAYDTLTVVKATTGPHTATLPAPALLGGNPQFVAIKIDPTSTQLVTLAPHATETIDGASGRVMWAGECALLYTDGTNWFKRSGLSLPMVGQVTQNGAQSLTSGVTTKLLLDTSVTDNTGLMVDTANNRLKVLRSASYLLGGNIAFNMTTQCRYDASIRTGGGITPRFYGFSSGGANFPNPGGFSVVTLSAGDDLTLFGAQFSGGSGALLINAGNNLLLAQEIVSW